MSGRELEEYLSLSPEREPSTHSLAEEEEEYEEDEKVMGDEDEEGEGEGEGEGESEGNDEGMSMRWSVKRLATVLGLSSFPLYGQ